MTANKEYEEQGKVVRRTAQMRGNKSKTEFSVGLKFGFGEAIYVLSYLREYRRIQRGIELGASRLGGSGSEFDEERLQHLSLRLLKLDETS